jgi:hypothetical protein
MEVAGAYYLAKLKVVAGFAGFEYAESVLSRSGKYVLWVLGFQWRQVALQVTFPSGGPRLDVVAEDLAGYEGYHFFATTGRTMVRLLELQVVQKALWESEQ